MKISLAWVSNYVDLPKDVTPKDLAHALTLKTVEVEDWLDTGAELEKVVIGHTKSIKKLGSKGHLEVSCEVGKQTTTVVSRATNLTEGMAIAVALPGAFLCAPSGEERREVKAAKVQGVQSAGVICTAADLGLQKLFPKQEGGEALDLSALNLPPGTALADAIDYRDIVLEVDNKSLTNRPDLWGHYGIARELAAIYGRDLKPLPTTVLPPNVTNLIGDVDPQLCRRLAVLEFTTDNTVQSPLWMRSRLARIGESSINLTVDLSNYVMFTVGQPTHVYDADKINLPLSVSRCDTPTKLEVLTGESRELDQTAPVIRDASGPVAVAGVMGGANSAVSATSTRFVLEAATFHAQPIRKASQRLSLRTEASARFEKALDTPRIDEAVHLFLHLLTQLAPSAVITAMQDLDLDPTTSAHIDVQLDFLTTRIGQDLGIDEITRTLQALGFTVAAEGTLLRIVAPTWRSTGDVSLPHDIVEEIARIHGYDNIPIAQLSVPLIPVRQLNRRPLDRIIREQLAIRADMQEVVTYPWCGDNLLAAAGFDKDQTLKFEGAPSPDRNSLRPSLIPNLLEAVAANRRYSQTFAIFEVGTVFTTGKARPYHDQFELLPDQRLTLAAAIVGDNGPQLFRRAKGALDMLRRTCHLTDLHTVESINQPWADRQVQLGIATDDKVIGTLGLVATRIRRSAGVEDTHVACFEIDLGLLDIHRSRENRYDPLPELPEADFDLSIVVADDISWTAIAAAVTNLNGLIHRVAFVDEFRGSWVSDGHRSVTLRITLRPQATTLTADDIAAARRDAIAVLAQAADAYLRE